MTLTPEVLVPRIGDVLVEQKLLTTENLESRTKNSSSRTGKGKFSFNWANPC